MYPGTSGGSGSTAGVGSQGSSPQYTAGGGGGGAGVQVSGAIGTGGSVYGASVFVGPISVISGGSGSTSGTATGGSTTVNLINKRPGIYAATGGGSCSSGSNGGQGGDAQNYGTGGGGGGAARSPGLGGVGGKGGPAAIWIETWTME
jgi:hypothetical protein